MDNQSVDGTLEYLKSLKPPFYWKSDSDSGIYDAMNRGIEISNGKWLYFLGSDDRIYDKNTFQNFFSSNIDDSIHIILGKIKYNIHKNDSYFLRRKNGIFIPYWNKKIWLTNTVHHQGVFYKRSIFFKFKFSKKYNVLADYHLNLLVFRNKFEALFKNELVAICGTNGISKKYKWKLYKEEIQLKSEIKGKLYYPVFYLISTFKFLLKIFI